MYSDLQLSGFHEFSVRVPDNYDTVRLVLFAEALLKVAKAKDAMRRKETTGSRSDDEL